jgi:hypothetical protein
MTDQSPETNGNGDDPKVVIIGPDGMSVTGQPGSEGEDGERHITDLVEQPAKVMRIGSMIRQLLEEVKAAPLDEASRQRLKEIHESSIKELEQGLAPELVEELERSRCRSGRTPPEEELRVANLAGRLAGRPLPRHQAALVAQQMAAWVQCAPAAGRRFPGPAG